MVDRLVVLHGVRSGRYMSKEDAAMQLRCTVTDVCKLMANGKIPLIKIDGLWYTTKSGVDKYERSIKMSNDNGVLWAETQFLDEEKTQQFLAGTLRSSNPNKVSIELATALTNVKPGTAKQFRFSTTKGAKVVQNLAREAVTLAGWYKEHNVPDEDTINWIVWRSNLIEFPDGSAVLTIIHLEQKKRSLSYAKRRNEIARLQAQGAP